jgi:hypothetical protein
MKNILLFIINQLRIILFVIVSIFAGYTISHLNKNFLNISSTPLFQFFVIFFLVSGFFEYKNNSKKEFFINVFNILVLTSILMLILKFLSIIYKVKKNNDLIIYDKKLNLN